MLKNTNHRLILRQFISFAGVGGIATAFHYLIYIFLVELLNIRPYIATGSGYFLSTFLNYYLNYIYTFRSARKHRETIFKFFIIAGIGFLLNTGIVALATEGFFLHYLLSQVLATGIVLVWNFSCNRWWTFRENGEDSGEGIQ